MCDTLRIAGIVNDSITDGPGLRTTIFVQGCPRRCEGCHNPTALEFDGGMQRSVDEIYSEIKKNPLITGVTLSGGEPFSQPEPLSLLAEKLKRDGLELAIYTGYLMEELLSSDNAAIGKLLSFADTVIDGPFLMPQRNLLLKFKGSENQRIIDVPSTLKAGSVVLDETDRWN